MRVWCLKKRTLAFAKDILEAVEKFPARTGASVIREQVVRSGTSVGANFHEADAALTLPDKLKSLVTARKEVHETAYWLALAQLRWPTSPGLDHALREAAELFAILNALVRKATEKDTA
ncbi:MAG: four helix bundle protein [Candidatus Brocadiae bacterium]|nr:four helix bundle protein [Candidatus Brocadiia bacterium]